MGKHQSEGFLQAVRRPKSYKEFIAKLCPFALQCAGKAILQLRFSFFGTHQKIIESKIIKKET